MMYRHAHFSLVSALLAALAAGCSKSPPPPPVSASPTDLGVVEFAEHTPRHFGLGDGKGCTVVCTRMPDAIVVEMVVEGTNADGTVSVLSRPRIMTPPGRSCSFSDGSVEVKLTPQWKTP